MKKTKYDLVSNSIKKTLITQNNLPWRIAFALFCTSCLLVSGFSVGLNIIKTEDEMNNAFEIDIMKTHRDTSRYHPDITQNKDETYVGSTGYEPYYYSIANIVNPANGNMHITETDLMLPCRGWGLGIDITRDYNTHNSIYSTMFGYGWTFQYNLYLIEHPDNSVVFVEGDGSFFTFNSTGGGDYSQSPGKTMRLHKNLDSSFTLKCCKGGTYTFNSTGTLLSISDKNDNHLYFTYFAEKLINITDDSGLWVAFQYNPEGYVSSLSDPLGRQVYYEYDGKGDLRNVTDPMGNKTMYFYCNESMCTVGHHLIGRVDVSGRVATFEHTLDLATELTKTYAIGNSVYNYTTGSYPAPYIVYDITYASEDVVQFSKRGLISEVHLNDAGNPIMISESDCGCGAIYKEWNSNMNLIKLTNERGYSWVYEYNQYGNILNETNPLNQTTTYTWENINTADRFICLIKTVTDFRGAVTTYTYDGKGNIYNVTDPTGNVTTYSYDTHGSILSIKDARGYYTNYTYDIHGAPASEINAEGDVTNYTYDLSRRLINLTDTNGYTTLYEFDHLNRLTKIIDPEHHIKIYDYNAIGDVVNITDENGNTNSLDNNFMNQVDVLWDPTGNKTEYTYDKFGNLIVFTDATGNSTHYYYNEINRLSETKDAAGNSERYTYDEVGNVQSFTDKTGNTTTFQYDALNRLTYTVRPDSEARSFIYDDLANTMTEIDEEGRSTTTYNDILGRFSQTVNHLGKVVKHYEYDAVGNIITQTDALGNSTCYTFNGNNIATELIDRSGNKTIYCYDSEGNLVNETDPLGYKINYSYDALNRLIRETDHFGNTTKYSYDAVGNLINMIDARGYNTSYQYDTLNRLVKQTDQLGNNQTYRYDALGNIIETIDERGNATHYYYDSLGRLIRETDALGYSILYDYDANGNLIKVTDKRGYETHYTYDSLNRLITIENPDGYTINSTYDQVGNVLSVTNERGYTTTYTYDDLNRLTHVTDATGNSSSYEYDDNNNLVTFIDPNGYYWNYTYDTLNRRTAIISPLGYTTQYTFDQVGNLVNITDANGTKTDYLYDALGRLRCITDALGYKTNYTYDAMDNVKQIEDANHYFTNFTYDPLNQLTQVESFGRTTDYQYDASGNQISRIDPMHHLTNYSYDELNRLKSRTYYPPTQIGSIYDYDPNGNLRYINKTTGSAEYYYEYDSMDRLTQATLHDVAGNLITTEYTYDPVGNRASLTYPYSGIAAIATYDYDKVDRLVNLTFNRGPIQETTNFVYDNAGRRTQTIHPNGVTTTYAYNKMNWISNLWTNNSAGNPLNYYAYTYDPVGNKLSESSAEGTKTYGYDKLYRLTHALTTYPDFTTQTIDYSYDPVGNRLDQKIDGLITTYTYGKNQLTSDSNGNLYYYDFNGNLQQIQGINNINFVYDFENRLTQISQPGKTINYQYTSIGNRLLRIEGSQRTFYAYDYEDMIQEYDDTGVPDATYLHGPGVDEPLSMYNLNTGYTYYYHQDGLGSVTELTDFTQIIVNTYRYDPFGKRKTSTSETVANPFEYTGREYDESANLYYYRARFYDPSIGRFISKDPLEGSFGTDLYIYTRNNPVNYVDPLGLEVVNMPSGRTIVNTPTFEYKNDGYAPVWFAFPNNGNYNVQASMAAGFTGGIGQPNWGPGPKGKQPEYDGKCTCHKECCCWITKPGEFKFTYKVKYVKSGRQNAPAQQGTHTLSLGAAAAINRHEDEHVKLAKIAHNAFINPLMQRVKNYTGRKNSMKAGTTVEECITKLKAFIRWDEAINKFLKWHDDLNKQGGKLDQSDSDYIRARAGNPIQVTATQNGERQKQKNNKLEDKVEKEVKKDAHDTGLDETDNGHGQCVMCTQEPPKSPTTTPAPSPSPTPVPVPYTYPYPPYSPVPLHPDGYPFAPVYTYLPIYFHPWNDIGITEPINIHDGDFINLGDHTLTVTVENDGDYPGTTEVDFTLERLVATSVQYQEGFEGPWIPDSNGDSAPPGWEVHNLGSIETWQWGTYPHSGLGSAGIYSTIYPQIFEEWLVTDKYDFRTLTDLTLSFYFYWGETITSSSLEIWASTNGEINPESFTCIMTLAPVPSPGWQATDVDLSSLDGQGNVHLAFVFRGNEPGPIEFDIDDVVISGNQQEWAEIFTATDGPYELDPDAWIESFFDITFDTEGDYRATFSLDTPLKALWSDDCPDNDIYQTDFAVINDTTPHPPPTQPTDITTWHTWTQDMYKGTGGYPGKYDGQPCTYQSTSTETGSDLYFTFYWGDTTNTVVGPASGFASATHIYALYGYYDITVTVKRGVGGTESGASDARSVHMFKSGDTNNDGFVSWRDIDPFVTAMSGQSAYYAAFPTGYFYTGDCNFDRHINWRDIDPFVARMNT